MNTEEKSDVRFVFQKKIHEADGQKFEDLFTQIMNYTDPEFQQVKPHGNIGDRKNDGYIPIKGVYYQVYAPEDSKKNPSRGRAKLKNDFEGLKEHWNHISPLKEFYFVINDKYKGVDPDTLEAIKEIKSTHNLKKAACLDANYLENLLFELEDDQIYIIVGCIGSSFRASLKNLDYPILKDVIEHIMGLNILSTNGVEDITLPDWEEKIKFNKLSETVENHLNSMFPLVSSLEKYLSDQGNFLANKLKMAMNEIYTEEKRTKEGDELFFAIVERASPRKQSQYEFPVIAIIAKYFEACDIFEKPTDE